MIRYRYMYELELEISGYSFHSKEKSGNYLFDVWYSPHSFLPRMIPQNRYGSELTKEDYILQNGHYFDCVRIEEKSWQK